VLEDGVTFQRIYAEAGEGPEANRLKGFRIINSKREYAEIIISFEGLAKIWIRELAKFINEVGFHLVYQTLRKIGKGSTACVYEIRRIEDKELFAAKVVLKAYLQQKEERAKSLSQEIAFLRAMDHENIIKLYGVFESDQAVYLIFERLQGGNLV
jgi:serine/threonine protein kinase